MSASPVDAPSAPVKLPAGDPLVDALAAWRRAVALESHVPAYRVLPNATLLAIAHERPRSVGELLRIRGMGPRRVEAHGLDILRLVDGFSGTAPGG